jgi:RNA polymerase sigma-70 factor (ECF subfamily)
VVEDGDPLASTDVFASAESDRAERFVQYYAQHHTRILAHIFALLRNEQDAEDVFQQTSLVLWRKFDQFKPEEGDFLAWACGVAHYEVRNFLRVAGRDRLRFHDDLLATLSEEQLERREESDQRARALAECMKKLSEADRKLVRRAYSGEQTIKQLADHVGRAVQTVYNRLNLIRRKLFECVERTLAEKGSQP